MQARRPIVLQLQGSRLNGGSERLVSEVSVPLSRCHQAVTQQLAYCEEISPGIQKEGRTGVSQVMNVHVLQASLCPALLSSTLM